MTRAQRRQKWRESWKKFIAQPGNVSFQRDVRRMAWKLSWKQQFKNIKEEV
jgi:hypothetical protein